MSQIHGAVGPIHRANSRMAITACAIVALAVTAACGGGQGPAPQVAPHVSASKGSGRLQDEPAGQILLKAEAATAALRSVRVSGHLNGASLDDFMSSPCDSTASITYQGAVVHEIRLGNIWYFQANAYFYQKLGIPNAQPARWRETTVQVAQRLGFLPGPHVCIGAFLRQVSTISAGDTSAVTKDGVRTVQGEPAVTLLDTQNDAVYVAATGQPYVLALARQGGDYLNFSGFNQPVRIAAPASCPPGQPALSPGTMAIIC
jgi:hypothetical protein